ncbi:hypothetical protein RFI_37233, partial [Reticulomyxa filosa]
PFVSQHFHSKNKKEMIIVKKKYTLCGYGLEDEYVALLVVLLEVELFLISHSKITIQFIHTKNNRVKEYHTLLALLLENEKKRNTNPRRQSCSELRDIRWSSRRTTRVVGRRVGTFVGGLVWLAHLLGLYFFHVHTKMIDKVVGGKRKKLVGTLCFLKKSRAICFITLLFKKQERNDCKKIYLVGALVGGRVCLRVGVLVGGRVGVFIGTFVGDLVGIFVGTLFCYVNIGIIFKFVGGKKKKKKKT